MRACTYARVSTESQAEEGTSLETQRAVLAAYCQRRGYTLVEHVADEGVSGKLTDRPGLRRIQDLARAKQIDVVVAVKLDRLGRANRTIQQALHEIRGGGVRVEFVEHGGGDRPSDRLLENVLGGVAEFEHAQIAERTVSGRYAKARAGRVPSGRAAYGLRLITKAESKVLPQYHGRDGELEIVESEAAVVREIFARYTSGMAVFALARYLHEQGVPTRSGVIWRHDTLRKMLRNPVYAGWLSYGAVSSRQIDELTSTGRPRRVSRARDESECVRIPVPAIIAPATWAAAQERLAQESARVGRPSFAWLLRGVVRCGVCRRADGGLYTCCGQRICNNINRRAYHHRRYSCSSRRWRHSREQGWCMVSMEADKLERLAMAALRRWLRPGKLAGHARKIVAAQLEAQGRSQPAIEAIRRELDDCEAKLLRLTDMAILGAIPGDLLAQRASGLRDQRKALQGRLLALTAGPSPDAEEAALRAERLADDAREALASGDPARIQNAMQQILRITLYRDQPPQIDVWPVWLG